MSRQTISTITDKVIEGCPALRRGFGDFTRFRTPNKVAYLGLNLRVHQSGRRPAVTASVDFADPLDLRDRVG